MSEWWTYTLSDFLLFSPRTYYRLIQRYNESVWPGHLVTVALGLGLIGLVRRPAPWQGRAISGALALLWGWVAWAFLWQRYATINWAATYLAWAFAGQAVFLAWSGLAGRLRFRAGRDLRARLGAGLVVLGVAVYPAVAPLAGRAVRQAEAFGIAPDPTAIATLGLLLLAEGGPRGLLAVVPVFGCLLSGATLWALGSPDAWVPLLAALLAALTGCGRPRRLLSSQHAGEGVSTPETLHPPT